MADSYKILAQETAEGVTVLQNNTGKDVYVVPAGNSAALSSLSVINNGDTAADYKLGVVKAGSVENTNSVLAKFVAVSGRSFTNNIYSAISTDGIAWMPAASLTSDGFEEISYGSNVFVTFAGDFVAYSTDAVTWTVSSSPLSGNWFPSLVFGDDKFVVIKYSSNEAAYSTDGISWTTTSLPLSEDWWSVAYGNGRFVATSNFASTAAYSTDGITWAQSTMPSSQRWTIAYGDNKFVAVPRGDSTSAYSTDGLTWTTSTLPSSVSWESLAYGNGRFVSIARSFSNEVAYSTDGIDWSSASIPTSSLWDSLTYGDGKFVAIGYNRSTTAYSTDGITWESSSMPSNEGWEDIVYGNNTNAYLETLKDISNTQTIIPTKTIAAGEIDEIVGGITLSAGDQIRIYSESPDLTVHIYGTEIS